MRKPRADAQRNRDRIAEVAKAVFASKGSDASLDEIARTAGVGAGTLYRHFPTREALVEEVYRKEVAQLAEAAISLSVTETPIEALRRWLKLFVSYVATKQIIIGAIEPILANNPGLSEVSSRQIADAIVILFDNAVTNGDIRADLHPFDLARALMGVSRSGDPSWAVNANQLVDILLAGLSQRESETPST